jgi:hypothetical protein
MMGKIIRTIRRMVLLTSMFSRTWRSSAIKEREMESTRRGFVDVDILNIWE